MVLILIGMPFNVTVNASYQFLQAKKEKKRKRLGGLRRELGDGT